MPAFRGHYLVIGAGLALARGKKRRAIKLIGLAEGVARDLDQPWGLLPMRLLTGTHFEAGRQSRGLSPGGGFRPFGRTRERVEWFCPARSSGFPFDHQAEYSIVTTRSSYTHSDSGDVTGIKLKRQLDALLQVSLALGFRLDPVALTRIALDEIIRILGAERGFLFLCKEGTDELVIQGGRDQAAKDLQELSGFSSTVVKQVQAEHKPLVVTGTEAGPVVESASIIAHGLRSIVAVPLMLKDRFMGVVYLDNRLAKGVFTDEDVEVLVAIQAISPWPSKPPVSPFLRWNAEK